MKLSSVKIDPDRLEQGAWVDNIPDMGDLRLKVRGIGNSDFRRLQATLIDTVPRQKRIRGKIDPDEQDRITSTCLLNTVLLDWDGVTDDEGHVIPYSLDMARTLLTDPAYIAFRGAVSWAAAVVSERGEDDKRDAVGTDDGAPAGN